MAMEGLTECAAGCGAPISGPSNPCFKHLLRCALVPIGKRTTPDKQPATSMRTQDGSPAKTKSEKPLATHLLKGSQTWCGRSRELTPHVQIDPKGEFTCKACKRQYRDLLIQNRLRDDYDFDPKTLIATPKKKLEPLSARQDHEKVGNEHGRKG
jgi:hypothetical protein